MPAQPFAVLPLVVPAANITTGNQRTESPASNLANHDSPGLVWRSNGNSTLWVRGNFGSSNPVDFVAVLSANAGPGTNIRVRLGNSQAEVDGTAPYDSGILSFISPTVTTPNGLYNSHLELPSVQNAQWFRIDISSHSGDFSAAHIVMGKKIVQTAEANGRLRYADKGFERGFEDLGDSELSRWGVAAETPGLILRTLSFKLSWVSEADFETQFAPLFRQAGKRRPILLCFDPEATVYRQSNTYFGRLKQNMTAVNVPKPRTFSLELNLTSMI